MSERTRQARSTVDTASSRLATRAWIVLLTALAILSLMVMWSAALLVLIGLLPSFAASLIDREAGHPLTRSVAPANAVGVLIAVLNFQAGPTAFTDALVAIMNPATLLVMYGAASLGWMLYLGLPTLTRSYLEQIDAARGQTLLKQQAALVEEWGPEVGGEK